MKALSILSVLPSLNESPLTYGVTLLVCMTSIIAFYHPRLFANLVCRPEDVLHEKHRYTLFTAGLIHAGWKHLLMNIGFAFYLMDDIEYFLKSDFGPYGGICLFLLFWVGVVVIVNGLTSLKYRRHAGVSIYGMSAFTCALVVFACLYYPMEGPMKPGSKTPFICGYQLSLSFLGILVLLATLKTGRAAGPHLTGGFIGLVYALLLHPSLVVEIIHQNEL